MSGHTFPHRHPQESTPRTRLLRWAALAFILALPAASVVATQAPAHAAGTTIVSLTFDDGNDNQFAAAQVLKANGLVGTFFITTSWIGTPSYLTQANLQSLAADGNEIGGHTVTHPDLTTLSTAKATAEVCNGRTTLINWGFTVTDFAFPFAAENSAAENVVKNCGYTSARNLGDIRSPASCGSCPYAETIPPGNAYNTAAPDEVDSSWTLKNLQDLVTNAETHNGGWVQLTFHHIAVGTEPDLTISPTLFNQFVTWLAPRTAGGTTVVRTVAQALSGTTQPPVNQAPLSAFTSSAVNLAASFDGSGTSDPGGSVASYAWNFGDGTAAGTGVKPSHSYATAGTYQVTLTATDNLGASSSVTHPITVSAPAVPTAPAVPGGVTAVAGNASASLSWTAPNNNGSAITAYTVTPYVGAVAQTPIQVTGAPPATGTTVTGLNNGTAYTFTVAASNVIGSSPASAPSAPVTPTAPVVPTAPAPPTGVAATAGNASATVTWTAPGNGGSAITSYTVTPYAGATAQTPVTITGTPPATSRTVTGLTNGTAYTFRVTARNAIGNSAPSEASGQVTPAAPVVPGGVLNGGFESGLSSWTTGGSTAPQPAATAHTGTGSALLGSASGVEKAGDSVLSQTITVPTTGNSTLSFWYQPHSQDRACGDDSGRTCRTDWMEGQIRSSTGTVLKTLFKLNDNSGRWTRVTANLRNYRGQTVTLWFNVHLDGASSAKHTWLNLDDVAVTNG